MKQDVPGGPRNLPPSASGTHFQATLPCGAVPFDALPTGRTTNHPPLPPRAGDSGTLGVWRRRRTAPVSRRPARGTRWYGTHAAALFHRRTPKLRKQVRTKGGRPPKLSAEKRSEEVHVHARTLTRRPQDEAKTSGVDLATYCREKVLTRTAAPAYSVRSAGRRSRTSPGRETTRTNLARTDQCCEEKHPAGRSPG
ncbi:MAG: hypothetical protein ACLR8Y_18920 [Alistipes indistinctus]